MQSSGQQVLDSFELLPEIEKRKVAKEIMRRTLDFDLPGLTDEELSLNAEAIFLEFDEREMSDEQSDTKRQTNTIFDCSIMNLL